MNNTNGNTKRFSWLFPYQKETNGQWWHRLFKVILILSLIVVPLYIWEKSAVTEIDRCFHLYFVDWEKTGQERFMVPLSTKDATYPKAEHQYADCATEAKLDGLLVVVFGEVLLLVVSNILYYRILLYIVFGTAKRDESGNS